RGEADQGARDTDLTDDRLGGRCRVEIEERLEDRRRAHPAGTQRDAEEAHDDEHADERREANGETTSGAGPGDGLANRRAIEDVHGAVSDPSAWGTKAILT